MKRRCLFVASAVLCAFFVLRAALAGTPGLDQPRADLVAVVNTDPANPRGGEISLMDLRGRLVRRVTNNNDHEEYPSFSPDGGRILFVRNTGGLAPGGLDPRNNEIFVHDLGTGRETRLTRNNVEDGRPEWSYDGSSIVFHSRRNHPGEKATLWIMGADGSNPRQLTTLLPGDLAHLHPNFAPDGQWVAFANQREENGYRYARVEKVRLDGSQRTIVSSGGKYRKAGSGGEEMPGDLEPVHSPDGAILWAARRSGQGSMGLYSFGAGAYYGGKAEIEAHWPVYAAPMERSPRFSPDGRRVLLTRLSPDAGVKMGQIVLTDPQSSFRRYLTSRDDWEAWHPSWHPFAHSRAEQEEAGELAGRPANPDASQTSSAENGEGPTADSQAPESGVVRPAAAKTSAMAAHEIRWMLDWPPEEIASLTFSYEGKFPAENEAVKRSIGFQLLDRESDRWVTVFIRAGMPGEALKILHEIAPGNFISRDRREVALRIIAPGGSALGAPVRLRMDVRRLGRQR